MLATRNRWITLITIGILLVPVLAQSNEAPAIGPTGTGTADHATPGGADAHATGIAAGARATGLEHIQNLEDGADIRGSRVYGDHVYAVGHTGFYVFDAADPENLARVAHQNCPGRDIAVSGGFAVIVREGGFCAGSRSGVVVYDVSDPGTPALVKPFDIPAHTVAAIGDTGVFHVASQHLVPYERGSGIHSGVQDIIDTRGARPAATTTFEFPVVAENGDPVNAPSCHEFYYAEALQRGYCAGIVETHIWDMTDPLRPKVLSVIKNPNISIHHSARPNLDGTLLIINDEEGGAIVPACHTGATDKNPRGGLWFYDTGAIAGSEEQPLLLSWVGVPTPVSRVVSLRCTSHYGEVLPNNEQAVWSWYGAGMVLVDFSDPLLPRVIDSFDEIGRDSWGANLLGDGYAVTGDMGKGLDVYRIQTA